MSEIVLVGLPIGNIDDITVRALKALREGIIFYAEDTRVFKKLLNDLGISYQEKFIDSFHDQSFKKIEIIIEKLKQGEKIYLVSDAGSPVISDPAYPLLKRAQEENIKIKTVPGVTSVIASLELSALPPQPFHFWGFLSRGSGEKKEFFNRLNSIYGTHIFFESPHRIYETIKIFLELNPEQTLILTREITKTHESIYQIRKGCLPKIHEIVLDKGECVLLFHNKIELPPFEKKEVKLLIKDYLSEGKSTKKLAKIFATLLEESTKSVYEQLSRDK